MHVAYKNTGQKVENNIWREYYCEVCQGPKVWSNIIYERELTDMAGGTVYICKSCVSDGSAQKLIKKHHPKINQ